MGAGSVGAALEVITLSDSDDDDEGHSAAGLPKPCRRPGDAQASAGFSAAGGGTDRTGG